MSNDPVSITVQVTKVLEAIGIPYFIGGSLASTFYGMIRTTQDSDIIADIQEDQISLLASKLQKDFYMDVEMIADAIQHKSSFNIIHLETMFKVDFFVPLRRHFLSLQFSRARREVLSSDQEMIAFVASAEDTLLAKLERYRLGGEVSDRQWRDVLGILKIQAGALDMDYLFQMAQELKVIDLLERAIKEAWINAVYEEEAAPLPLPPPWVTSQFQRQIRQIKVFILSSVLCA
jgi:hypothetical protein